ncbi:hypothetical protein [Thalassomonas actiniarum]|uniref:Uncharacterized protein n=1 Tax=Thalassomonas actiniarum TaxID=485447 RepID=A0AAF0BZX1_9GAMM|nr:hypothetical protein [Thalassomonas actiniarum]WDD98121.1 hypothetical protein SG35_023000 [Thalassomonas actiniarum]
MYYGRGENNNGFLNALPLNNIDKGRKYLSNNFSGYDASNGKVMISDIESLEGDVHRTMN